MTDVYGICRQSILPLYKEPSFDSALVSQLLFGECYQVRKITSTQNWYKIFHEDTELEGWITSKSLKNINSDEYQEFLNQDFQVVTSPVAVIEYLGTNLYLLPGSRLHFSDLELFNWQDHIGFTGSVRSHAIKSSREELIDIALKYLNAPFQSGGRSIFGLDEKLGFALIYSTAGYGWKDQRLPGKMIPSSNIIPGDLLIFKDLESKITHMSMYLGAEEVMWMDEKMKISDIDEWESIQKTNAGSRFEVEGRSILS
ncbi:hypothetical protein ALPR1_17493 [Algoriphagus machipongonensis]|uniref:Uncharacterized protein n=1 Tax=Algoriphagus machipongonensis TaxID=388413 RepID=A3I3C0_9BACT|nr:hypothetical protein ALPR1_17493 [Algoriphagus machipongonensis]